MDFGSRIIPMTGGAWNLKGDLDVDGNIPAGSIIDITGKTNHHNHCTPAKPAKPTGRWPDGAGRERQLRCGDARGSSSAAPFRALCFVKAER